MISRGTEMVLTEVVLTLSVHISVVIKYTFPPPSQGKGTDEDDVDRKLLNVILFCNIDKVAH